MEEDENDVNSEGDDSNSGSNPNDIVSALNKDGDVNQYLIRKNMKKFR